MDLSWNGFIVEWIYRRLLQLLRLELPRLELLRLELLRLELLRLELLRLERLDFPPRSDCEPNDCLASA